MEGTRKSNLTRGASIMVVCVAIAKFLGVIWIIPVTQLIHTDGLGIYANAYSMYIFLLTLSTSGLPSAMGKLISERLALKKYAEVEQMYRVTMKSVTIFGIIAFFVLWFGAPFFSMLMALKEPGKAAEQMVPSIRALACSLLVIPIMSGLRGYLQGFQQFEASAYSQAVEQLFRVVSMVIGAYIVVKALHMTVVAGAAAATFGAFVGGIAGLILLVVAIVPLRRQFRDTNVGKSPYSNARMLKILYGVALPISLGALITPISSTVDTFTIQNLLMSVGQSYQTALSNYGIYSRQALYLAQLPLAFAFAIGASVLPAIAEAKALNKHNTIQKSVIGTFRTMLFIVFPTAAVLLFLAHPIDFVLNKTYEGVAIIRAVSFMSIFASLELISTYMLQGLGKMYRPVRNMFLGIVIKLVFNIILILFMKSVMGAAIATTIGYMCSSLLNVMAVKKYGIVRFSLLKLAAPFFISTIPLSIGIIIVNSLIYRVGIHIFGPDSWFFNLIQLFLTCAVGAVIYLFFTLRIGAIREDEVQNLPGVGRRLATLARKLYKHRAPVAAGNRRTYR